MIITLYVLKKTSFSSVSKLLSMVGEREFRAKFGNLTPHQTRELDRRIEEYESGSATLLDWFSVKSKVLGS